MTREDRQVRESETTAQKDEVARSARRPYQSPRLRHLGSVRELTLGNTGANDDRNGRGMMVGGGPM